MFAFIVVVIVWGGLQNINLPVLDIHLFNYFMQKKVNGISIKEVTIN